MKKKTLAIGGITVGAGIGALIGYNNYNVTKVRDKIIKEFMTENCDLLHAINTIPETEMQTEYSQKFMEIMLNVKSAKTKETIKNCLDEIEKLACDVDNYFDDNFAECQCGIDDDDDEEEHKIVYPKFKNVDKNHLDDPVENEDDEDDEGTSDAFKESLEAAGIDSKAVTSKNVEPVKETQLIADDDLKMLKTVSHNLADLKLMYIRNQIHAMTVINMNEFRFYAAKMIEYTKTAYSDDNAMKRLCDLSEKIDRVYGDSIKRITKDADVFEAYDQLGVK